MYSNTPAIDKRYNGRCGTRFADYFHSNLDLGYRIQNFTVVRLVVPWHDDEPVSTRLLA